MSDEHWRLKLYASSEGMTVDELRANAAIHNSSSQNTLPHSPEEDSSTAVNQQNGAPSNPAPIVQQQAEPWHGRVQSTWKDEALKNQIEELGQIAYAHHPAHSPVPPPAQAVPVPSRQAKSHQDYRQNRVDRVSNLLTQRYQRIFSDTNSPVLADKLTGEVVPEFIDAVASKIATEYRQQYSAEVSRADIKRAFEHYSQLVQPSMSSVFFGRAGYDHQHKVRFIVVETGECLIFGDSQPFYTYTVGPPCVRPTQSRPLLLKKNLGNVSCNGVDVLFNTTALPKDADILIIAWMILSWMPDRKQVMLELLGAPSSVLEDAHKTLKRIVDPATEDWRNEFPNHVKQFDDLALAHYLLSFNQVDTLTTTQQKHLFSLLQGKNVEWKWKGKKVDATISVTCPVILNSLESVATDPKLANSTLSIEVEEGAGHHTSPEHMPMFEPTIVASALMIFGYVNANWKTVAYDKRFDNYGGLADLCRVGELVAGCLHQDKNPFWSQFDTNQQSRRAFELEESPVASALERALAEVPAGILELAVKDWLVHLEPYRPVKETSSVPWPSNAKGLGAQFKQIRPLLRDVGISLIPSGNRGPVRRWRAERIVSHPQIDQAKSYTEWSALLDIET